MKPSIGMSWAFAAVAVLSMVAALLPLLKGGEMNVVFLSVAVVFFALGVVMARKAREHRG